MLRTRPLVPLAAGFVTGIACSAALPSWPAFLAVAALAGGAFFRFRHPALLLFLGLGLGGLRSVAQPDEIAPLADVVEGTVDGPPRIYRALEDPDAGPSASGSFVVGSVQVRFYDRPITLIGGERVRVRGRARRPGGPTNPGQFDYAALLHRRDIDAILVLDELEVLEGPPAWSRARQWLYRQFDKGMGPETAALERAVVLGRRESVPDDLVTSLQRSGTAHLLAISGTHLVTVMLSLFVVLTLGGVRGRTQTIVLLCALLLYTLLTGARVSVLRAFLMMACYFGADLAWRRRDAASAIAASALLICSLDPRQVFDAGFQLSYTAVLGLLLVAPVFRAYTPVPGESWFRAWLRAAVGVSAAAWLATAPLVLEHFNLATPGILAANLLLVPLLTLQFVVGLVHLVLAPVGLGIVSGTVADLVFATVRGVSGGVTSVPGAYVYAPSGGPVLLTVYYLLLAGWTWWCRSTPRRPWRTVAVVAVVIPLGLTGLRHRAPEGLHLAVLDVGRGSCAYLEWPDGRNAMVDCGSLDWRDPGSSIAAPYLWSRGVTRLDTLVLSHPDADHVNGADSVIDLLRVRRVVVTRAFTDWEPPPGVEKIVVERVAEPVTLGALEFLGPPVWEKVGGGVAVNETSIVVRTGGVLLPGDIMDRGAEEVMELEDVRARVLVMPHHGKYFDLHREFVGRVAPETIVVSAPEGYFHQGVIDALPVVPRITGREGAVELLIR